MSLIWPASFMFQIWVLNLLSFAFYSPIRVSLTVKKKSSALAKKGLEHSGPSPPPPPRSSPARVPFYSVTYLGRVVVHQFEVSPVRVPFLEGMNNRRRPRVWSEEFQIEEPKPEMLHHGRRPCARYKELRSKSFSLYLTPSISDPFSPTSHLHLCRDSITVASCWSCGRRARRLSSWVAYILPRRCRSSFTLLSPDNSVL